MSIGILFKFLNSKLIILEHLERKRVNITDDSMNGVSS